MNGTTKGVAARSVQMAVLSAPTTSIGEAVAEVRRRLAADAVAAALPLVTRIPRAAVTPAATPAAA